jgi:Alpha-kinase family/von Willebrand factor type A domain
VEKERAVADRLKREADLSATEAKFRELQLKRELRASGVKSGRRSAEGMFKAVCSTDLLFLIDTTGSMSNHIKAAKDQVRSIMKDINLAFLNEAQIRFAVVGYKDHGDSPNIQFLDFTSNVDRVHAFLNNLIATGGNDEPEDVLGGLRQALNASWKQQTRCIVHIADAPPHGHKLQNSPCQDDRYPSVGYCPHGITLEPMLNQLIGLSINYALLRINNSTDRMALAIHAAYIAASADCVLLKSNLFYVDASVDSYLGGGKSKGNVKGNLLFEEAELGTTFSALRHLIVNMVTSSASRTAIRASTERSKSTGKKLWSDLATTLGVIGEDNEGDAGSTRLETVAPKWNLCGWLNETLMVEGFSPDVVRHDANTLNDMMAHDDNIAMGITELTVHKRDQPFAQGALRVAFYARTAASTNRYVVKSFKRGGKRLAHLAEDMRCQALCKAFALDFNALLGEEHSIDFIVTTCLKEKSGTDSGDECLSLEPFIEGTYVKYNNNCGFVNKDNFGDRFNQAGQAFSHFTFERSQGRFLVCDIQGVENIMTDPVIHTLDPERFKLADANLGKEGFKFFFATHTCNSICAKLGLKSNAAMVMSGKYEFREAWLSIYNTVCCSNKLCGKIMHLASSKISEKFPGHHWCDSCWPQLRSSIVKLICLDPGPHHEFEVSRFFYESQGRSTPRRCTTHQVEEELDISTAESRTKTRMSRQLLAIIFGRG